MKTQPEYSREQLCWYRSIPVFDRTHWWTKENGQLDDEHSKLLWQRKVRKGGGKRSYAPEPILWEILRRHPDLGPASEWAEHRRGFSEKKEQIVIRGIVCKSMWLGNLLTYRLFASGHKNWCMLEESERAEFRRELHSFLLMKKFNVGQARVADDPPILDLCGDLSGEGHFWEWILSLSGHGGLTRRRGKPRAIGKPAAVTGLIQDSLQRGYRVMILRIDPCEDNAEALGEEFVRVYKNHFRPKTIPYRVRPEQLRCISDFERDENPPLAKFRGLFAPFTFCVTDPGLFVEDYEAARRAKQAKGKVKRK